MTARFTPCGPPHTCDVSLSKGSRKIPTATKTYLDTLKTISAVYVVSHSAVTQYVGQSQRFGARFQQGVASSAGYQWPVLHGKHRVAAWEFPGETKLFRQAVEIELAMRIRLATGQWPVELGALSVNSPLRSSPSVLLASTRAAEMTTWLINNDFIRPLPVEKELLDHFEAIESKRPRPSA